MKLIIIIAWRNIWRNRRRSIIMITAITVGLWGGLFAASFSHGLLEQRFETSIEQHISHMQIHHPDFIRDQAIEHQIHDWAEIYDMLSADGEIKAFSGRTILSGMLSSANLTRGVRIMGINPELEAQTTGISNHLVSGTYFAEEIANQILVGKKLAEKTKLQERSRLVLTFQDQDGELVSAAFRVAGIYQTANSVFDESHIFVLQSDLQSILDEQIIINEIALLAKDAEAIPQIRDTYQELFPANTFRTWNEIATELSYLIEMARVMITIILIIILLALGFGLVNTMLMSVFERTRELGMLLSVGMNKTRVFLMILFETAFLSLLGTLGGILLSVGFIYLTSKRGIDLASVGGDSMEAFGFSTVVYPSLSINLYFTLIILVIITAILTTIYPALKATRLSPAEAVRDQ